ncbi:hypothetical protein M432DRAFT_636809 [Thermoascus aurantiacus ATCC 26904]
MRKAASSGRCVAMLGTGRMRCQAADQPVSTTPPDHLPPSPQKHRILAVAVSIALLAMLVVEMDFVTV